MCIRPTLTALLVLVVGGLVACSHGVTRVNYPVTTSPSEVMQSLEADIQNDLRNQTDVLARRDFVKAVDYFDKAKEEMRDKEGQRDVLQTLGYSRAYLNRAEELAAGRREPVEGILDARHAALKAGLRKFPRLSDEFSDADESLSEAAAEKRISPDDYSKLQQKFLALELKAIQSSNLEAARGKIEGAKQNSASSRAPNTLRKAEMAYASAMNEISSHRHEETLFLPSVLEAKRSADLLVDVMNKIKVGKTLLPESVALRLVMQERGLTQLKDQLASSQAEQTEFQETISVQDQKLKNAKEAESVVASLRRARGEFQANEADVYRDGDNLLIRLKAIEFKSGRSELPASAIPLLGKVKSITDDLRPLRILIEGHTDSTGGARINNILSQKRAEAVAQYLVTAGVDRDKIQAIGYGFTRPIADNKTKAGRAQNRRVDVVITPAQVETSTTSM